jgi:DnaJ-class molecular chaperone
MDTQCETCSGKGYIETEHKVERCDECYHAGRITWTDDLALAEHNRRRELKKAIRATHRGTMGDPMRPTTR